MVKKSSNIIGIPFRFLSGFHQYVDVICYLLQNRACTARTAGYWWIETKRLGGSQIWRCKNGVCIK